MSEFAEHSERWHDDIAAYALHALDMREAALLEHHLEGCGECAERLRWIMPAVNVVPSSVVQHAPPPELRSRLMAIVEEEAAAAGSAGAPAQPERRFRWLPSFEGFALRPTLAGAAVVMLLVAGVAGYELRNETASDAPSIRSFAAKSLTEGSLASGTLDVDGDQGSLRVSNLPPTEKGDVYQAWIKDNEGSVHPSSVFVVSDDGTGAVSIPSGLFEADKVMVTREPKGGSELPTEDPLLAAELS